MQRFSVIRAAMITGSATLLSRLLGFLRDVMIAAALGAGPLADIFVVAFRLPNLFRRLFAEGAFSAAFVPLFAQKLENDTAAGNKQTARQMGEEVFAALFFALLVFTALAELAMPYFVYGLAGGFAADADKFARTVTFSRITFLYLICMSLMALFAAMLNAKGRFAAAGFAPVLLNIILIGALLLAALFGLAPLPVLIWGVAVAGFAQLIMVWVAAHKAGLYVPLSLIFRRPRFTPNVRRVLVLGVPGVLAAGVGQINLLIGTNIASAQESAAAWLYYAYRLYQLPLGVIGIALSVALLPDLARRLRANDKAGARASLNRGLEVGLLLTLPAAFGLYLLAEPICAVLFQRGAFTPADTQMTALALMGFSFGLPSFVLIKILQPSFVAREDTRTPFIYGAVGVAANITLSLLYFPQFGHVAIAVATSIAGWLTAGLLFMHAWVSRAHAACRPGDRQFMRSLIAIMAGCVGLAGVLLWQPFAPPLLVSPHGSVALALWLGGQIIFGACVFFALNYLAGGIKPASLMQFFRKDEKNM